MKTVTVICDWCGKSEAYAPTAIVPVDWVYSRRFANGDEPNHFCSQAHGELWEDAMDQWQRGKNKAMEAAAIEYDRSHPKPGWHPTEVVPSQKSPETPANAQ